jgi:hypothetical protein
MSFLQRLSRTQLVLLALFVFTVLCGIALRVYNLKGSGFFFYDEGLYLNYDRGILEFIQAHHLKGADAWQGFLYYARLALASGKSLWFFVIDSRFLWGGLTDWEFSKVMACVFGVATFPVFFLFVKRFYNSTSVALLAVALLALLPGHVFYSRSGLQEAFSIFLVLSGFYFYFFPRKFGWRTVLSGIFLAAAFFANYRLCMLPLLVVLTEFWIGVVERKGFDWRKYSWFFVAFFALMVLIGNLFNGANTTMIFAWVFHQGDTAKDVFSWVNFLSYPYYLFRLESWILTLFFFGNIYFVVQKRWDVLWPFVLVCAQVVIFSMTNEKGVRYIAVVLPFFVMSAAYVIQQVFDALSGVKRTAILVVIGLMFFLMAGKSAQLAQADSSYEKAARYLIEHEPDARFFSPQDTVMGLYVSPREQVRPVPVSFDGLLKLYNQGYRYLVLGPQSYVDCASGGRFVLPLRDYLGFIDARVDPVKVYPHLNYAMMERFVFEHSTNLVDSVRFLGSADIQKFSSLRIYDLSRCLPAMARIVDELRKRK